MEPATKQQKIEIRRNAGFKNVDLKEEWVQWATEDVNKRSLNDLTYEQADAIIRAQTGQPTQLENWGHFDKTNSKHRAVLSLMRQAGWVTPNERHGEVPDLQRLSLFLHSARSPVNKPLKKMEPQELSKIIYALEQIVISKYRK